jgi:hypothetical protein
MENEKLQEQISLEISKQVSQKVSEFVSKVLDNVMNNEEFSKRIVSITNKSLELSEKIMNQQMEKILNMQAMDDDQKLYGLASSAASINCCQGKEIEE